MDEIEREKIDTQIFDPGRGRWSVSRKRFLLVIALTLVLLGIILAVIFFFFGQSPANAPSDQRPISGTSKGAAVAPIEFNERDKDRDGIADSDEKKLGTSDYEFDSDGDGLSDRDEIEVWKTDPSRPDTDGDGYSDGYEIIRGYSPTGTGRLGF